MKESLSFNNESSVTSPALLLFDVDGTLIRTEGPSPHSRAFHAAFKEVYGVECRFTVGMHGMTDLQIYMALAENLAQVDGRGRDLALQACRRMVEIYQRPAETDGRYVALPGAHAALGGLAQRDAVLGLVTGNAPEIAQHKLASVGLAEFFAFGAFGTEADERSGLPPIAIARAEAITGKRFPPSRVFVVGDTPRDVACALDNGCRAVGVPTGSFAAEELAAAGAELVLPSLEEIGLLMGLLVL